MLFVTISRTAALAMATIAAVMAIAALYLFLSKADLTFSYRADVEVSCDAVAGSVGLGSESYLDDRSFTLTDGELDGDDVLLVESQCDRQRTMYASGMALTLAPAAALIVLSLFPWKVPRDDESTSARADSTASVEM